MIIAMGEQLSEDEFHRMQLQILELRTENYQLKDDKKKLEREYKQAAENEAKLEREVNKQVKLRKAFTTLNKSKQAVEFEQLLQQNEQAFILQNQTLAEELSKLQTEVKTLENENRQFKRQISLAPQDKAKDAELRKLQAANTALKQSLAVLRESQSSGTAENKNEGDVPDGVAASNEGEKNDDFNGVSPSDSEKSTITSDSSKLSNKDLIKPGRSESDADLQVQVLTLQEEKRLLEFELDNLAKKHDAKVTELSDALNEMQTKLNQKQKSCNSLQKDINELQTFKKGAVESATKMNAENEKLRTDLEQASSDASSLQRALQDSHTIVEQQQGSLLHWQKQVDLKDEDYRALKTENVQNSETLSKVTKELESTLSSLELLQKEKDGLQGRYEKSANVGEALLNKHTDLERKLEKVEHELQQANIIIEKQKSQLDETKKYDIQIENLKKELKEATELAERRKKIADSQSVEVQQMVTKLNEKTAELLADHELKIKSLTEEYESRITVLQSANKAHEEELIRVHHQERVKTREIDGLQQKMNDLAAEKSSLENSKGWFERALQDAEKLAEEAKMAHEQSIENLKDEHEAELEKARLVVQAKDEEIHACELKVQEHLAEVAAKDGKIKNLKRDIKDEVQKQKLVEKKVHSTLKDLKKQLVAERKKKELLQEKITQQSDGKSNVDELLTVVDNSNQSKPSSGGASSVSSFSFRDFINPGRSTGPGSMSPTPQRAATSSPSTNSTQLSPGETTDLLARIAELQNEKWSLEEKVQHLEESGGAMADELVEKTEMVQRYVQHTRTDSVKRNGEHTTPKSLKDKVRSFVTGNEESPQSSIGNIYELNKKLTRMLEEEMTKNMALKKDMQVMAEKLSATRKWLSTYLPRKMHIEKGAKVKVLVLGDSGVGKSSLTHLLCHNEANKTPGYTIGCSVEIKLHDYKVGTPQEQTYCLEIWDIGASNSHTSSRFIFYSGVSGIILAHDLTNRKSLQNLNKWLHEVFDQDPTLSSVAVGATGGFDSQEVFGQSSIPVLMIGTKLDLIPDSKRREIARRSVVVADSIGSSEIYLDCAQSQFLAPGSGNAVKLSRFFDKVVEHAKLRQQVSSRGDLTPQRNTRRGSFGMADRRRFPGTPLSGRFTPTKSGHQD